LQGFIAVAIDYTQMHFTKLKVTKSNKQSHFYFSFNIGV